MERHRFGTNLDAGIPLSSEVDFELLYVSCFDGIVSNLADWIKDDSTIPLMVGGQIGSGKSTLINKVFRDSATLPDVSLHFDRESLNLGAGDFWTIILTGLIKCALHHKIDLSFSPLPSELGQYSKNDWRGLLRVLSPSSFSMKAFADRTDFYEKIGENSAYIRQVIVEIGNRLEEKLHRSLLIFASGLDKFDTTSPAFFAMQDPIGTLLHHRTLLEVNAVHLFAKSHNSLLYRLERRPILAAPISAISDMLWKRMGVYGQNLRKDLNTIADWSGGNPRQAVRLLSHYEANKKVRNRSAEIRLKMAITATMRDFFSYSRRPSRDLITTIKKSGRIDSSLFELPGDKETARLALYGNWFLLTEHLEGTLWRAVINPLVSALYSDSPMPTDYETHLLAKLAGDIDVSPVGVGPSRTHQGSGKEKSGAQLLWEVFRTGIEQPVRTNLAEIFTVLSAALLSNDRVDRSIIAYRDKNIVDAARSYLFAKANTYKFQRCKHIDIEGGKKCEPLREFASFLAEDTDVFSIGFTGKWEHGQLDWLDRQRDQFIEHQMLWWVHLDDLNEYLAHWVNLRQLFELFILEDELLRSLSIEDIEADLAYFRNLDSEFKDSKNNVVKNLKMLLKHLMKIKEQDRAHE
jgi:hypothetical protein